jgi:hypothetical protein
VALGGWSGVWVAKRVPQNVMRAIRHRGRSVSGGVLFRDGVKQIRPPLVRQPFGLLAPPSAILA